MHPVEEVQWEDLQRLLQVIVDDVVRSAAFIALEARQHRMNPLRVHRGSIHMEGNWTPEDAITFVDGDVVVDGDIRLTQDDQLVFILGNVTASNLICDPVAGGNDVFITGAVHVADTLDVSVADGCSAVGGPVRARRIISNGGWLEAFSSDVCVEELEGVVVDGRTPRAPNGNPVWLAVSRKSRL